MEYMKWNNLIAGYFFNENNSGRDVLLYVNEELINRLGASFGADVKDFVDSVKKGPDWVTRPGFCQKALQVFENWRDKKFEFPPYISYLAFFVLAAGTESNFAVHAYYPRVWKLLEEPENTGTLPSFERMIELWDDLEKWSREDKHEELGRFVTRIRGGLWKVGLPLSQTLISEDERKHLNNLFDTAGLDPTDAPSPDVMPGILKYFGHDILNKRTIRLLESKKKEDLILLDALVELVLSELEDWDGTILEDSDMKGKPSIRIQKTGLRICINIDNVSKNVRSYLRFKTNKVFPEEGLNFIKNGDSHVWSCSETHQGWSKELRDYQEIPPIRFDASKIDWKKDLRLIDDENNWKAYLRGSTTRLFIKGEYEGLPDWIETQRLEKWARFLVTCVEDDIEKVNEWGTHCCKEFEQKNMSGLPENWIIFYGRGAKKSCPEIDVLSVSSSLRLLLKGGIKTGTGRGNRFLEFAPPKILLENSSGNEIVTINNRRLKQADNELPIWELPENAPIGVPLRIEVVSSDQPKSRVIMLEKPNLPNMYNEVPCRNSDGQISETDSLLSYTCGANMVLSSSEEKITYSQCLPIYLSDRIDFIGERPGQIIEWPHELLPSEWHPVWALANKGRKKWEVHFCGTEENIEIDKDLGEPIKDKRNLKRWKKAVWNRRKVTKQPKLSQLKIIWGKYIKAAYNV